MSESAKSNEKYVLSINGGSSSIKFALFQIDTTLKLSLKSLKKYWGRCLKNCIYKT